MFNSRSHLSLLWRDHVQVLLVTASASEKGWKKRLTSSTMLQREIGWITDVESGLVVPAYILQVRLCYDK